jgi:hypothetical protein
MTSKELKQQILKTVQYHAIEEEISRVCYELAIEFAKQEAELAFYAGSKYGITFANNTTQKEIPNKEQYINQRFTNTKTDIYG